jgi:triosephosphate isomerase (TIM)
MLKDAGASAVIVGHSERRQHHGETDAIVAAKAKAADSGASRPLIPE